MPAGPGPSSGRRTDQGGKYGSVGRLGAGGTLPLPANYGKQKKAALNVMEVNILIGTPCVIYVFFLLLFMFYSFFKLSGIITIAVVTMVVCCGVIVNADASIGPFRFGATCCLFAVFMGSSFGWYIHERRVQFWYGHQYGERYGNVVPSELATAHADAAVIGFEHEAYVDIAQSVGYTPLGAWDDEFCVAPVVSPGFHGEIQYFAAGTNCCSVTKRGSTWTCDNFKSDGQHSGIVIFDTGVFYTKADHYRDAIRMAAATWDLQVAKDTLIVRWVSAADVGTAINREFVEAWGMAIICVAFGVVVLYGGADLGARSIYPDAYPETHF
jgi:hypothetical protein